jgi:transcriptional regulator with XRE-family HTH domain
LGLSQQELATRAGVAKNTVHQFEAALRTTTPNNIASIRRAIEEAGLRLLFDEKGVAVGIARGDSEGELSSPRS